MARSRATSLTALFVVGVGAFANLYATQPLLPRFRESFRASELVVSLTVSASVLAVALTSPWIGSFSDRIGRKRVIVAGLLGLAVTTGLSASAAGLGQLVAWRFLQGCFVPAVVVVTIAYIAEESRPQYAGATMATYMTGTIIGGFGGRFTAGLIAARWDWHAAFAVLGAATLAGALATWWLLPRATKFVPQRNAAGPLGSIRTHLKNRELLATYAVGFEILSCLVAAFTYGGFYLADKPFLLGPAALASVFTVYLLGAAITPLAGHFVDRIGHRRTLMAAVGLSAAGMALTLVPSVAFVVLGLALEASGTFVCQSTASSHVGTAARSFRSAAAGLYISSYYLGGFAGSVLPGLIWQRAGWPGCVAIIFCVQLLTVLIVRKFWQS